MKRLTPPFLTLICALSCNLTQAEITLPNIISSGMVLQRGESNEIYGKAEATEAIRIEWMGNAYETQADSQGNWSILLPEQTVAGPEQMIIEGDDETVLLRDVYVGDVWLCSGQSNMELPINRVREKCEPEIANSKNPYVRCFTVKMDAVFEAPQEDCGGSWKEANPRNLGEFPAAAYFFAREAEARYHVPIGIVVSAVGGSPIEAWMSEEALQGYPKDLEEGMRYRSAELCESVEAENNRINTDWYGRLRDNDAGLKGEWFSSDYNDKDWTHIMLPGYPDEQGVKFDKGTLWLRKTFELPERLSGKAGMLELGTMIDSDEAYINGVSVGSTPYQYPPRKYAVPEGLLKAGKNVITIQATASSGRLYFTYDKPFELKVDGYEVNLRGSWKCKVGTEMEAIAPTVFIRWKPMGLYNAMLAPLLRKQFKGVLWYQGESNIGRKDYRAKFRAMLDDWRKKSEQALPCVYAQLPVFGISGDGTGESGWAEFRNEQRLAQEIPGAFMASCLDLGEWNDIHALSKAAIGKRLALAAFANVYGEESVIGSGPLPQCSKSEGGAIYITFDSTGAGLMIKGGGQLQSFAVAGDDGIFKIAEAVLVGRNMVRVTCSEVSNPKRVRYAWADSPLTANLYNAEGLPASPFELTF
ncbi:MAG: hypothetical protein JW739_04115 [Opitutales bacterium]|nr:hypothetical protein [Opitutales bacterium]